MDDVLGDAARMEIHSRQTKTGETDKDDGIAGISIYSVELYRQTRIATSGGQAPLIYCIIWLIP